MRQTNRLTRSHKYPAITMPNHRSLPTPDGLAGERVDVGLARLLGISRTRAADLVLAGLVDVNGKAATKSHRLAAGEWLEVELPDPPSTMPPEPVPGLTSLYEDQDLIAVDKPVGVAAHPSPGWEGPTVVGGLRAAGVAVADVGPAERQGIVHRLDVGTSGVMVVAKSGRGYSELKRQFKDKELAK